MNTPCGVIRDLLPLYAEELTSEESKELVRAHLDGCADCRKRLEELKTPAAPAPDGAEALRAVKHSLRRRRLTAALLAALLVFLPLFALSARSTDKVAVPYEEGLIRVESVENGAITFSVDGRVSGVQSELCTEPDTGETTLMLQAWSNAWHDRAGLHALRETYSVRPVPDRVLYGFNTGSGEQALLYGEEMDGGMELLPRLVLGYYLIYAAALALLFGLLWLVMRKKKAGRSFRALFLAAVSYPLGHLLIKGTHTLSFFVPRDLAFILGAAAAIWGLLMLALRVREQER